MRRILWSLCMGVVLATTCAASSWAAASPQHQLSEEAAQSWRSIRDAQLSADGAWLVYALAPDYSIAVPAGALHDTVEVVVRSVSGEVERRYPAGAASSGGGGVQLSGSGRWAAFHRATARAHEVVLIDLASGAERSFAAQAFQFNVSAGASASSSVQATVVPEWLALGAKAPASTTTPPLQSLTLHPLAGGEPHRLDDVHSFAFDPLGAAIAVSDRQGLLIQPLTTQGEARLIESAAGGVFSELTWSEEGSALAALYEGQGKAVVYGITDVRSDAVKVVHAESKLAGATVVGPLHWRAALDGVYFQVRHAPKVATTGESTEPAGLSIWRADASGLPMEQRMQDERSVMTWHYLDLSAGTSVQLTDERLTLVAPQARGAWALAYDLSPYGWMNAVPIRGSRPQRRDYYLISLGTGERTVLLQGVEVPISIVEPQLTPEGGRFLYWQQGDYLLRDLVSGRTRNLTASLPTSFTLPENDPVKGWFPDDGGIMADALPLLQGWSVDGEYVLISNHWDIWALSLKGKAAINLTGDGVKKDRIYRRLDLFTGRGAVTGEVELSEPMYLAVFDRVSGERGVARRGPQGSATLLHQAFTALWYMKAAQAPVWVVGKMTATTPFDYYAVEDFKPGRRLTDANPHAGQHRIGGVRYLRYRTSRGELRHAKLLLPTTYEMGRRYPMVVEIYKGRSQGVHIYISPVIPEGGYHWLSRGYAMLLPDIIPRMDEAGPAALESVLAGVDAAIEAGVADPDRLGLYGHSYGGYQTQYIISQSDRFKVAAAWAGPSNLWNWCTDLYGGNYPGMVNCEFNQPYVTGPWWSQWSAYLDNSPLYHARSIHTPLLLAHGDQDRSVPFYHSVMLFNTLRRLERPVVLLAYAGKGHHLEGVSDDLWTRQLELFDHYLRNAPVPAWWVGAASE